jgi:ADP-ribose pyrophosphatase YjhB (NUDIX family)
MATIVHEGDGMPDPAAGKFEMPGGHLEQGETPRAAALREFQEESGLPFPDGEFTGTWTSANGIYQGFVYTIAREADLDILARRVGTDPDGDVDGAETLAWWDPADLPGNPAVRAELLADMPQVLDALGCGADDPAEGDEATCPCGTPVVYDEMNGWQHDDGSVSHDDGDSVSDKMAAVAKAAVLPKGRTQAGKAAAPAWPGWKLDLATAAHWAPRVSESAQQALSRNELDAIAAAYIRAHPGQDGKSTGKRERNAAALAWLLKRGVKVPARDVAAGIAADGVLIGGASAEASAAGNDDADTAGWEPGETGAAKQRAEQLGLAALLLLLSRGGGTGGDGQDVPDIAGNLESGYLGVLAGVLAGWDPDTAADELGGMLADAVADGGYAGLLSLTQITVAAGQAAFAWYLAQGGVLCQWQAVVDSRTCPACLDNDSAGPRPAGAPWPSGDTAPPAHANGCRCALAAVSAGTPAGTAAGDGAAVPA